MIMIIKNHSIFVSCLHVILLIYNCQLLIYKIINNKFYSILENIPYVIEINNIHYLLKIFIYNLINKYIILNN